MATFTPPTWNKLKEKWNKKLSTAIKYVDRQFNQDWLSKLILVIADRWTQSLNYQFTVEVISTLNKSEKT